MKRIIIYLVILIVFTNIQITKAISYVASDLTYLCLGGNNYLVSVALYHDCIGVGLPAATIALQAKCSGDSSLNFIQNLVLIIGSGNEVTPGCGISPTTCSGGTRFGVKEYIYQGVLILNPCNNWTMSHGDCCRNNITTIFNSSNTGFRINAMLNNLDAPCNSSCSFSNKPIAIICKNNSYCFNHGANDPNGDSLVYSFVSPETSIGNSTVNYYPPYSYSNFLPSSKPISIDNLTGDICLEPSVIINSNTMVKIDQYKNVNGTLVIVGTNYREIQFRTILCNNFIPILSGMDFNLTHQFNKTDTLFYHDATAGEHILFDINAFESDTFNPDLNCQIPKLYISWNQSIPQANLSVINNGTDSVYAHFNWIPNNQDVSNEPHCFSLTVHDNAIPYYGSNTFRYCIKVGVNTFINKQENQCLKCKFFPNPTKEHFKVVFENEILSPVYFQIINENGQKVQEGILSNFGAKNEFIFNISELVKGFYVINLNNGEKSWSSKFLVE